MRESRFSPAQRGVRVSRPPPSGTIVVCRQVMLTRRVPTGSRCQRFHAIQGIHVAVARVQPERRSVHVTAQALRSGVVPGTTHRPPDHGPHTVNGVCLPTIPHLFARAVVNAIAVRTAAGPGLIAVDRCLSRNALADDRLGHRLVHDAQRRPTGLSATFHGSWAFAGFENLNAETATVNRPSRPRPFTLIQLIDLFEFIGRAPHALSLAAAFRSRFAREWSCTPRQRLFRQAVKGPVPGKARTGAVHRKACPKRQ